MKKRLILFLLSTILVQWSGLPLIYAAANAKPAAQSPRKNGAARKAVRKVQKKMEKQMQELKKITQPMEEAVQKTAETAVKEVTEVARGAHTLGGKFLQGIINVMTAASPGKTRVYLPAPSANPNSGVTVGFLPVFLFVGKNEVVKHILAPSVTHNNIFGVTSTMRYYWYPKVGAQLFSIGSYALETNRRFTLRYEDPHYYEEKLYIKFDYTFQQEGSTRFSGFGTDTRIEDRANYTIRENHLQVYTGVNFLEHGRFTLGHRIRQADVYNGPIDSLPRITNFSPRPEGVEKKVLVLTQKAALLYDSRNLPMAPVSGHYAEVFGEFAGHIGGDARYAKAGGEVRGFYPSETRRFVTAWRFLAEAQESGSNVPFYERAQLGGRDSLRGYGDGRFADLGKTQFSLEERVRLYTLSAFNVNVDFEAAPFYEAGTVFNRAGLIKGSDLHHVGGIGFRAVVRPNVVGVVDVSLGDEGTAVFVGIDYPF